MVTERSATRFQSIKRSYDDGLLPSISPKLFAKLVPYLFGYWRGNITIFNFTGVQFKSIQRSQCQCDLECFTSYYAGIRDSGWIICHRPLCYVSRLAEKSSIFTSKIIWQWKKLIILRNTVAIRDDVKRYPKNIHFLCNAFSPESVSILLFNTMRISNRFGKFNTKLVCAL